jgi:hypothetical protein
LERAVWEELVENGGSGLKKAPGHIILLHLAGKLVLFWTGDDSRAFWL